MLLKKIAMLFLVIAGALFLSGCEQEGAVKIDDCREHIKVDPDGFDSMVHNFTCQFYKGGATCDRIETDNNGHCLKDYYYFTNNSK